MKVGINASFLRKSATGIGQVTTHFLNELFRLKRETNILNDVEVVLYLEEEIKLDLPDGFSTKVANPPYKRDDLIRKIWWEKYTLPNSVVNDECDVFISMYQCPTIINNELKHIMIVHDVIHKIFQEYLGNIRKKI